jgi:excisionase family DNA binding protein
LSPLEVAEQLGVSDQTVYNWIRARRIAALKMGRLLRIRQSELERFVAANSTTAAEDQAEFWEDPDAQALQTPGRSTWR